MDRQVGWTEDVGSSSKGSVHSFSHEKIQRTSTDSALLWIQRRILLEEECVNSNSRLLLEGGLDGVGEVDGRIAVNVDLVRPKDVTGDNL